jgi:hypothetical protein
MPYGPGTYGKKMGRPEKKKKEKKKEKEKESKVAKKKKKGNVMPRRRTA